MHRSFAVPACLLSACFLAACADTPTAPSPETGTPQLAKPADKKGGSGGGGVVVDLTGPAASGASLPAKISSDTPDKLSLNSDRNGARQVALAFTGAASLPLDASGAAGTCQVVPADAPQSMVDALYAQLTATVTATLWMEVDRNANGGESAAHHLEMTYDGGALGTVRLGIPAHPVPPPTVTFTEDAAGGSYTYSGGTVRVWALLKNGTRDDVKLFCRGHGDSATAVLTR